MSVTIVCIGSSTTAGTGPTNPYNAWVAQLNTYLRGLDVSNTVVNLGVSGVSSYRALPTGTVTAGRPDPLPDNNITKALTYDPDVIVLNYPTNDVVAGYSLDEMFSNFATVVESAGGVPVWVTTSQPRNVSQALNNLLRDAYSRTLVEYPARYLDFWTGFADANGDIEAAYNVDGTHLNDAAHKILIERVIAAGIVPYESAPGASWFGVTGRPRVD